MSTENEPNAGERHLLLDRLLAPEIESLFQRPERLDKPSGWWGHVPFASWVVEAVRPRLLVELGTHHGVSYAAFCEAVRRLGLGTRCFAIDNWQGDAHAGRFDESVYQDFSAFNAVAYSAFSELLRTDFDQALGHFSDGSIDLLHIDGFHRYESVRHDYETWLPKLSRRAVVLFHDTQVRRDDFGVHRLFAELAAQHPHFEFMHGHGLGLLAPGEEVPPIIQALCDLFATSAGARLRERFASAGARWIGHAHENAQRQSFDAQAQALLKTHAEAKQGLDTALQTVEQLRAELSDGVQRERVLHQASSQQRAAFDAERLKLTKTASDLEQRLGAADVELTKTSTRLSGVEAQQAQIAAERDAALAAQRKAETQRNALEQGLSEALDRLDALTSHNQRLGQSLAQGESAWRSLLAQPVARPDRSAGAGWGRNPLRRSARARAAKAVASSLFFDASWYLERYPDVAVYKADPALHYAVYGHLENRDPGPWFSTGQYLAENPDVAAAGTNPLVHYELHGRREQRHLPTRSWMPPERLPRSEAEAVSTHGGAPAEPLQPVKEARRVQWQVELAQFLASGAALEIPTAEQPLVTIVMVLHNQAELSFKCFQALAGALDVPCEVIVVDNASSDRTADLLSRVRGCRVLTQPQNLHFLKGANLGARQGRGEYLLFLNNDAQLRPGSLLAATRLLSEQADVGVVGGKVILLDGSLQEAGSIVWRDGSCSGYGRGQSPDAAAFQFRRDVHFVSGACLVVRRQSFEALQGFDEAYAPAYYEETDLCMRLRRIGWRVVYDPGVVVDHYEYGSSETVGAALELMERNRGVFLAHHREILVRAHPPHGAPLEQACRLPSRGTRVLFLDDQVPAPSLGSGFPRAQQLIRSLQACGASVVFCALSQSSADWAECYRHLPCEVEVLDGTSPERLANLLRDRAPFVDAVLVSRPHNMERFLQARHSVAGALDHVRVIYDAEAIFSLREALRAAITGEQADAQQLQSELKLAHSAHVVLAVSEAEAAHFRQAGLPDVRVLGFCAPPNPTMLPHRERHGVLFVGRLDDARSPNVDSVRWFIREVMPLLDQMLGADYPVDIVGRCSQELVHEFAASRARFHGQVDDLNGFYERARLFIAPTRFAAGIPIKVQEAAGHGLPAVVSGLIARQLGWSGGQAVLAADSAQGFAERCALLYRDEVTWQQTRSAALTAVGRDCDPAVFDATVRAVLAEVPSASQNGWASGAAEGHAGVVPDKEQLTAAWHAVPEGHSSTAGMNWMAHPMVVQRLNAKASGSPAMDAYAHLKNWLDRRGQPAPVQRVASLGSGTGALELGLAQIGMARGIDGYEPSEHAVREANARAAAMGLSSVRYHVADLERLELPEGAFDVVFGCHAVHRVSDLDRLFSMVKRALRPGGVFHLQEYVGPDRFQWTDAQLAHMNGFLEILPQRYLRLPNGSVRGQRSRPDVADVMAHDPSSAACSSEIVAALRRHFQVLELRELGGALLHIGLSDIAQNFDPDHPVDRVLLKRFFDLEDRLMAQGAIASDFAVIVATHP